MSLNIFEGIHKYGENICPLRTLVDILEKISSGRPFNILEIALLNEFPETNELLPRGHFSPRWIIEYMMKVHGNTMERISRRPSHIDRLIYRYNSGDEEKEYVFSNNMMFHADIITVCYLYFIRRMGYEKFVPLVLLVRMLKAKYNIYDRSSLTYVPYAERITWYRIAYSYPSITFAMLYHNIVDFLFYPCTTFYNYNLPKCLYSPFIASIIPALDRTTPLALLLALAVFSNYSQGYATPLRKLYHYTFGLYTSKAFPISLKLKLCEEWGIVHIVEGEYEFAPCFRAAYRKARNLIKSLKANDPGLVHILLNI